jgi:molybdopterin synthase catalytic subunit
MVLLTAEKLNPEQAIGAVVTEKDGAYVLFVGIVRDHSKGRQVTGLEYDVYPPLATAQLEKIILETKNRWGLACAVLHRHGYIAIGETAVVVCVASPHRAEAFEACAWVMDTIKKDVPIWKKEFATDGTYWIEGEDALPATK